jgi:outer membrane protein OmpA-like peptidoglycan-associated protein
MRLAIAAAFAATVLAAPVSAAQTDCPPLGHMPGYTDGGVELRDFDHYDFKIDKGDDTTLVTVAGRTCSADYNVGEGKEPLSDLEIQTNYRAQLQQLGATILHKDDNTVVAKLAKDGKETWLYVYSQSTSIEIHVVEKGSFRQTLTTPGKNDYHLLGHMPNYYGGPPEHKNFDKFSFKVQNGDDSKTVDVTGATYHVDYDVKSGAQTASDDEIQANYRAALKALNAQTLYTSGNETTARLEVNGQSIWIYVYSQQNSISIDAVEEKALTLSIQPPSADAMQQTLDKAGHIALYINFDFNKATLRADAAPVIAQIVALLKKNAGLKVSLQGHTDNVGGHDYNVKLSKDRAAAVVAAVVKGGIDAKRLGSTGFGPDKPIADNDSADGRAKNRRVELVKAK